LSPIREQSFEAAFEWMCSVLQKEITYHTLRREIGDLARPQALAAALV
jgi:hypothetical protein